MNFDNLINSILKEEELSREDRIKALKSIKILKREEEPERDAEDILDDLWDENGDGEVSLAPLHYAITGVEWDGEDESHFEEIIETMRELYKTIVRIDAEREAVILIGGHDEN